MTFPLILSISLCNVIMLLGKSILDGHNVSLRDNPQVIAMLKLFFKNRTALRFCELRIGIQFLIYEFSFV